MNDEARRKYEEELIKDAERIMEEVNNDPDLKNVTAPPEMRESLFDEIHAKEEECKIESLSAENRELIRLGKIYQKKRKSRKYLVLVAAMVLALAFGITSMGGAEKICEKVTWMMAGREQSNVDSEEAEPMEYVDEVEVYEEIEEKFGFCPVKLDYLPEGVGFQEATISDEIQGIHMVYGSDKDVRIFYYIRPNYRISSYGTDVEDQVLLEYALQTEDILISVRQIWIEETKEERWTAAFSYNQVDYFIMGFNMQREELEKILNNLYF